MELSSGQCWTNCLLYVLPHKSPQIHCYCRWSLVNKNRLETYGKTRCCSYNNTSAGCREYHGGFWGCNLAGTAPGITRQATEGLCLKKFASAVAQDPRIWYADSVQPQKNTHMTSAVNWSPYRFSQQSTFCNNWGYQMHSLSC